MKDIAYVTESMKSSRILSGGLITSLPFSFNNEQFSICVIPKANISDMVISNPTNIGLIIPIILMNSNVEVELPVFFCQWTEASIKYIPEGAFSISDYDVYFGASAPDTATATAIVN